MGRDIGKNISKNFSAKYSQKLLEHAQQSAANAFKTASKRAIQKIAEAAGDWIGDKIADKITGGSRTLPKDNLETNEEKILRKKYISAELRQKIIDDLKLKKENYWLCEINIIIINDESKGGMIIVTLD